MLIRLCGGPRFSLAPGVQLAGTASRPPFGRRFAMGFASVDPAPVVAVALDGGFVGKASVEAFPGRVMIPAAGQRSR
jgi:hypothetical protein